MKKGRLFICSCISMMLVVSCGEWVKPTPVKDYIVFLENHKSILEEKTLIGWSSESRIGNNEGCILMYNYYDPFLSKSEDVIKYMNYHILSSEKAVQDYGYNNDTIALCNEWDIDVCEYSGYIESICKSFHTLVHDHKIDFIQFYGNGLCFFSSSQNGWNLFYRNESTLQNIKEQESLIISKGYSRLGETDFWVQVIPNSSRKNWARSSKK